MLEVRIKKNVGQFCLDCEFLVENEVFALLGASGSGKSMTLKCIAGIETPDYGRIAVDGHVLFDSERKINVAPQKRRIGYLFEDYALFPHMTVRQNIMSGMGKRPDVNAFKQYISRFFLQGLEEAYPRQLSGGQKQRAAMARMLAAEPDVLLLDEPFSALDSHLSWQIEQQTRAVLEEWRKPTVFVSHSRDEVFRLCERAACIHQGKIEEIASVRELFLHPATKTAAVLTGCKNIAEAYRLDSSHISAPEWGVTLLVPVTAISVSAVGIRSHHLKPEGSGENYFPVHTYHILEDAFEWNLSFRTKEDGAWIQWSVSKTEWSPAEGVPEGFWVSQGDILLFGE